MGLFPCFVVVPFVLLLCFSLVAHAPVFCHACCQATLIGEDIEVEGGGDDLNEVGGHHENSGEG